LKKILKGWRLFRSPLRTSSAFNPGLPQLIRSSLTDNEKAFIVSVKEARPQWELLGLPGIDKLPSIQWKLANIRKMDKRKHAQMLANLKKVLDL